MEGSRRFPLKTRLISPGDRNFVLSSWLKSNLASRDHRDIRREVYYEFLTPVVSSILERAVCLVLCDIESPDHIYGYIVYEPGELLVVHYVFVKHSFRRFGFAKMLIDEVRGGDEVVSCSFVPVNRDVWEVFRDKYGLDFNPMRRYG